MKEKLGILDWGIGGFGLYRMLKASTDLSITYFSDSGYTPYGKVDQSLLRIRVLNCINFLKRRKCTVVAIACNAAGISVMDQGHPNIVNSGIRLIQDCKRKNIGVIGGETTIASKLFECDDEKTIFSQVAQKMSAHIEVGNQYSGQALLDLEAILFPIKNVEALLLACTHYTAIAPTIKNLMNPEVMILDPTQKLAKELISTYDFQEGNDEIITTGNVEEMKNAAKLAFNVQLEEIHRAI
ncbi:MAG: aspartate/glutamate racemase family protein [Flavobacteriales bacterium]|nr:aspartate/glutamate racemase family protein [Flavobacteriales bacterium]